MEDVKVRIVITSTTRGQTTEWADEFVGPMGTMEFIYNMTRTIGLIVMPDEINIRIVSPPEDE